MVLLRVSFNNIHIFLFFINFCFILYLIRPRCSIEHREYANAGLSKNYRIQPRIVPKTNSKSDNSETP